MFFQEELKDGRFLQKYEVERGKSECFILKEAEWLKERETIGRRFLEAVHAVIKGISNNFHIPIPIDAHSTCVQYTYFPAHFEKTIGIYIYTV